MIVFARFPLKGLKTATLTDIYTLSVEFYTHDEEVEVHQRKKSIYEKTSTYKIQSLSDKRLKKV